MHVKSKLKIVGICGSLRKYSCNRGLLRALEQQLPDYITYTEADLSEIPFYNVDNEQPFPESVIALKELVDSADALVISSPEYNMSYTAFLKNTLEWLSRPDLQAKLVGKPVALIGAAAIGLGVSQSHLRDVMYSLNMKVINRPIVHVTNARERFDKQGNLIDNSVKEQLENLIDELINSLQ